jgi:plastocyanin
MTKRLLASTLIALSLIAACGDDDDDDGGGSSRAGTGGAAMDGDDAGRDGAGTGGAGSGLAGSTGACTGGAGAGGAGTSGMGGDGDGDGMNGERMIEVVATEFMFEPDTITASPGDTLIVTLRNDGSDDHNIEFELPDDDYEIDEDVAPGQSAELTVPVPDATGDYVFYCPIAGHRQLGMEGTLTVQ